MNYEKKYKEALEKAKDLLAYKEARQEDMEYLFPELKESEDEKIREELIKYLKEGVEGYIPAGDRSDYQRWLAWLEKQGEKKHITNVPSREVILSIWDLGNEWRELTNGCISTEYGTQLDYIQKHWHESEYYLKEKQGEQKETLCDKCKKEQPSHSCQNITALGRCALEKQGNSFDYENANIQQKDFASIEPKFKVGDWIIHQGTENIYQVVAHIDNQYQLKYGDNYTVQKCADVDRGARLWTINDAKDGDVLAVEAIENYNYPFVTIYKERGLDFFNSYCFIGFDGKFYEGEEGHSIEEIHPATKEQRELLFKKMKEAGYEWDAEKKEVKKIKPKILLNADEVIEWLNHRELRYDDVVTTVIPDDSQTSVPYKVKWLSDEFIRKFKKDFGL